MGSERPLIGLERPLIGLERPMIESERLLMRYERRLMRSERSVIGSERPLMRSERPLMGSERPLKGSERPLRPLKGLSRGRGGDVCMYAHTHVRMENSPVLYRTSFPLGPLPKRVSLGTLNQKSQKTNRPGS